MLEALTALLTAVVVLAPAGCAGSPKVDLTAGVVAPKRDLAYTKALLVENHRLWATLDAECQVAIASPRINLPQHQVPIGGGRLRVEKPGRVSIVLPEDEAPRVRLVGDGRAYRVDMPLFGTAYSGKYTDPVPSQSGGISFLPADVADALEPTNLFSDRVQTLTQWEELSGIHSLELVTSPELAIRPTSLILFDRRGERITAIEKYNDDGSIRARIQYVNVETVLVKGRQSVKMPTVFDITYPDEQTTIRVQLGGAKLNSKLPDGAFDLSAQGMGRPAGP